MAIKRMFAKSVIGADDFLDLPTASQILYIHLNMSADDDGFIGNLRRTVNSLSLSAEDDLKLLFVKGYLISFPSGVVVITHWRVHNSIRKDRYTPTIYQEELSLLKENKAGQYFLESSVSCGLPSGVHSGYTFCNQAVDVVKNSIDKNSIGKVDSVCVEDTRKYFDNEDLNNLFHEFLKMRKTIGRPMMDVSIAMMIKKLGDLSGDDDQKKIKILENAVLRGTPDIYPLDSGKTKQQAHTKIHNFPERDNEYGTEIFENSDFVDGD